jgi:hypothetical protein
MDYIIRYKLNAGTRFEVTLEFASKSAFYAWEKRELAKSYIDLMEHKIYQEERDLKRASMAKYHGEIAERLAEYKERMAKHQEEWQEAHAELMELGGIL